MLWRTRLACFVIDLVKTVDLVLCSSMSSNYTLVSLTYNRIAFSVADLGLLSNYIRGALLNSDAVGDTFPVVLFWTETPKISITLLLRFNCWFMDCEYSRNYCLIMICFAKGFQLVAFSLAKLRNHSCILLSLLSVRKISKLRQFSLITTIRIVLANWIWHFYYDYSEIKNILLK